MKMSDFLSVAQDALQITIIDDSTESEIYEGIIEELEITLDGIRDCEISSIDGDYNGGMVIFIKKYEKPTHKWGVRVKVTGYVYLDIEAPNDEQAVRDAVDHEMVWNVDYGDLEDTDTEYIDAEDENGNVIDLD